MLYVVLSFFTMFAVLDWRYRNIRVYWFVIMFITILSLKLVLFPETILSWSYVIGWVIVSILFALRAFALGDYIGLMIAVFAINNIYGIPFGAALALFTVFTASISLTMTNIIYNMSDVINKRVIFDIPKHRIKKAWWFISLRRYRITDKHFIPTQYEKNGVIMPNTIKSEKCDRYVYVRSAHPGYVYILITLGLLIFLYYQF